MTFSPPSANHSMAQRVRESLAPKVTLEVAPECPNPATIDLPPDDEDITIVVTATAAALNAAIPVVRDRLLSPDPADSGPGLPPGPPGDVGAVALSGPDPDLELVITAIKRLCTDEASALALNPHQSSLLSRSLRLPPRLAHKLVRSLNGAFLLNGSSALALFAPMAAPPLRLSLRPVPVRQPTARPGGV